MLVTIFCEADDFCKFLSEKTGLNMLGKDKAVGPKRGLIVSEIMTISIFYSMSNYKNFKSYYNNFILKYERSCFPNAVSYGRFIELRQEILVPMLLFIKTRGLGNCNGVSIIDSTTLEVCHVRRASSHKLFKNIAQKGKSSTGWFYGFKLHLIINSHGEITNFHITPGNIADNNHDLLESVTQNVFGKLVGDKGYIGAFKQLYDKGIQLIHGIRKNMKNVLMTAYDKFLLKKRGVIESVIGLLKEMFGLESSKNRSKIAYFVQICSAIAAYNFKEFKPQVFKPKVVKNLCIN